MMSPQRRELVVMGVEEEEGPTQDGVGGEDDEISALQAQEGVELTEGWVREEE